MQNIMAWPGTLLAHGTRISVSLPARRAWRALLLGAVALGLLRLSGLA
jgi:hypothetical protein